MLLVVVALVAGASALFALAVSVVSALVVAVLVVSLGVTVSTVRLDEGGTPGNCPECEDSSDCCENHASRSTETGPVAIGNRVLTLVAGSGVGLRRILGYSRLDFGLNVSAGFGFVIGCLIIGHDVAPGRMGRVEREWVHVVA